MTTPVAVLEREPVAVAAVRGALVQRREDAARSLAFERAAECRAQLGAIEWIVAEQKVTMQTPQDLDIHGWADDVLVTFRDPSRPALSTATASLPRGERPTARRGDSGCLP